MDHKADPLPVSDLDRQLLSLLKAHPGLTITGVGTAVVVLRVLSATHLRLADALAVLAAANPAGVLAGTVLTLAPLAALLAASYLWIRESLDGWSTSPLAETAAIGATLAAFVIAPWYWFLWFMAITAIESGANTLSRRRRAGAEPIPSPRKRRGIPWLLELAFLAGIVLNVSVDPTGPMWVPEEAVTLQGGPPVAAFVIGSANGWTTLLRASDGAAVMVRPESIIAREPCVKGRSLVDQHSLVQVLGGLGAPPAVRPCP